MKTQGSRFKSVCVKALVISSCLTFIATGASMAESIEPQPRMEMTQSTIQTVDGYDSESLKDKHAEVDRYLFEEHNGKFDGFKVTHTGPVEGFIEVGITPFEDAFAAELYEVLGEEQVNVIEGQQAHTLVMPVAASDEQVKVVEGQQAELYTTTAVTEDTAVTGTVSEGNNTAEMAVPISAPFTPPSESDSSANVLLIGSILLAVIVLGGASYFLLKARSSK